VEGSVEGSVGWIGFKGDAVRVYALLAVRLLLGKQLDGWESVGKDASPG
jgi:hypothetical protein